MKLNKYITKSALASVAFCAVASLFAQEAAAPAAPVETSKEDAIKFIKLYGSAVAENCGADDLQLSAEEKAAFVAGVAEGLDGKISMQENQAMAMKAQQYLAQRAADIAKKVAAKAQIEADKYFKELDKNSKISKTASGLYYEIIEQGSAEMPKESSTVKINYKGALVDGKVFDSSEKNGAPVDLNLAQVIPGFREGLQKVGKGGKIKLHIPSKLGYGDAQIPGIPAGSTLVFDVEIVDITEAPAAPAAVEAPAGM